MKNKSYPLLLLGVLTVALTTLFLVRNSPVPMADKPALETAASVPAEVRSPESSASPAPASANRFSIYQWRQGEKGCWQFGVTMRMASSPEKIAEGGQTRLGGKLQLAVLSADAQRVTLAAALSETWFDTDGRRIPRYEELFNGTPAILTLSPAGNLLELAFPRQIPADDRKLLCFAYGWEFVARQAAHYQEQEYAPDGHGSVLQAAYQRADALHIRKTRQFQSPNAVPEEALQGVVASEFTATVGKFWVSEMSGWEDTLMHINGEVFAASRISVLFREETNAPAISPALLALLSNPGSAASFSKTPDPMASTLTESVSRAVRREMLAARWGAVPFEQVLNSVQSMSAGTMEQRGIL